MLMHSPWAQWGYETIKSRTVAMPSVGEGLSCTVEDGIWEWMFLILSALCLACIGPQAGAQQAPI